MAVVACFGCISIQVGVPGWLDSAKIRPRAGWFVNKQILLLRAAFAAMLLSCAVARGQVTFQNIVWDGGSVPDDGGQFSYLGSPVIDDVGNVVFSGAASNLPPDDWGVWSGTPTNVSLVAAEGTSAPGGGIYQDIPHDEGPYAYGDGNVAIAGDGGLAYSEMIWGGTVGNMSALFEPGSAVPDTNATNIGSATFGYNDFPNGAFAGNYYVFQETINGGEALWSNITGSLHSVAISATQTSGATAGEALSLPENPYGYQSFAINTSGTIVFAGTLEGNADLLMATPSQGFTPVVTEGQAAPGTPAGDTFSSFSSAPAVALSNSGQIAFAAILQGSGVNSGNELGIWAGSPGALSLVARSGEQAPGLASGTTFTSTLESTFSSPGISGSTVVFSAILSGPGAIGGTSGMSLWSWTPGGGLSMIAQAGDPISAGSDVVFNGFGAFEANAAGQIVFIGYFGQDRQQGVWLYDPSEGLVPIAYPGELLQISPGVYDTVENVDGAGGRFGNGSLGDGASILNDAGQIPLELSLANHPDGEFIATVPEPASLLALFMPLYLLGLRRARSPKTAE
ncbi:MAG: choice-of-anchor tandem repeat NxxGxxAF-containing protein [Tepidisphaeraceae bacterium]|jgi:hypothetical protein